MKVLSKLFFVAFFVLSGMSAWADAKVDPKVSPYNEEQISDYNKMLKEARNYQEKEDYFLAVKAYIDAILKYPIVAEEAYDEYYKLYNLLSRAPGKKVYDSDEKKAEAYRKLFNDVEIYLGKNARFDVTYSYMHRLVDPWSDEEVIYLTKTPGIEVEAKLDYYSNMIVDFFGGVSYGDGMRDLRKKNLLDFDFPSQSSFSNVAREKDYCVDGAYVLNDSYYNVPTMRPFFAQTNGFRYEFEVVDLNGKVIVPSEYISRYAMNPEVAYGMTNFYIMNTLPPKAKSIYEQQSMDFSIKISRMTCPYGANGADKLVLDSSRYAVYRNKWDVPSLKKLYDCDEEYVGSVYRNSKERFLMEQNILKDLPEVEGLVVIPGKVAGHSSYMKIYQTLYAEPITAEVYREITGMKAPSSVAKDSLFNFVLLYNQKRVNGITLGFETVDLGDCGFEAEEALKIERIYGYKNPDALFYMTKDASKFDPNTFVGRNALATTGDGSGDGPGDEEKEAELMVLIPGGKISFEKYGTHTVEVSDFWIGKYLVPLNDINVIVKGSSPNSNSYLNFNANLHTYIEAVAYCNLLSERYGYTPCYKVGGTSDVSKWEIDRATEKDQRKKWKKINCDYTADGFRLPTLEERLYVQYKGMLDDESSYKIFDERVDSGVPDKLGLYRTHDHNEEWCSEYGIKKVFTDDNDWTYLYDCNGSYMHTAIYQYWGSYGTENFDAKACYIRICRSTPEESRRLAKLTETKPLQKPSKDEVASLLTEVAVEGGKFDLHKANKTKFTLETRKNVTVDSFYMATTETTQKLYTLVMGENPSPALYVNESYPANNMTIIDACIFCNRLSEIMGFEPCYSFNGSTDPEKWEYTMHTPATLTLQCSYEANGYRLPTNAEWEWAANGGLYRGKGKFDGGKEASKSVQFVSSKYTNKDILKPVAKKNPNSLGIYDLIGNVAEYCFESEEDYTKFESNCMNPHSTELDNYQNVIVRGGNCFVNVEKNKVDIEKSTLFCTDVRYTYRTGFRVVRNMN